MSNRFYAVVTLDDSKMKNLESASESSLPVEIADEVTRGIVAECKTLSRVDTGEMRKGWTRRRIGHWSRGQAGYRVFNPVEHAIYNEFGTRNMSAQPMLRPAIKHASEKVSGIARKALMRSTVRTRLILVSD